MRVMQYMVHMAGNGDRLRKQAGVLPAIKYFVMILLIMHSKALVSYNNV